MVDTLIPLVSISYAVGRLGCILSGDGCYGIKCPYNWPAPFAMAFPYGANPWQSVVSQYGDPNVIVYNTPLFEALFSLAIFIYLWNIRKNQWFPGLKTVFFLVLHGIFRFFIEFIRRNPEDVFGMTQGQFVSIVIILISLAYCIYNRNGIIQFYKQKEFVKVS